MSFDEMFRIATEHDPYQWQHRLASDPECRSRLIDIPTGLGKTAGVVLAWLWNRCSESPSSGLQSGITAPLDDAWPRRLVYCLPMRTLVEQTEEEVKKWLNSLPDSFFAKGNRPRVVVLMGGESPEDRDWDLYPEEPAIIIGTQDMLLSRALNRGYGMSRYRWPMHFALLNNDCLWVMDEVQLMGAGIQTARQLDAFRCFAENSNEPLGMGVHGPAFTWYCSATTNTKVLTTREWRRLPIDDDWEIELTDAEENATGGDIARNIAAYLVAAHHGKVRLSIRSLPDEWIPPRDANHPGEPRFARGVWDVDTLPGCDLGGDVRSSALTLSLERMELALCEEAPFADQPFWAERTLDLRDSLGPFHLAFLETLLRAPDGQASKLASEAKTNHNANNETREYHQQMATATSGGEAAEALAADPAGRVTEHGLREGAGGYGGDSRNTRPDRTTRYVETTRGVLSYSELAPILAERVARAEADLFKGLLADRPLLEDVFLDLHSRICEDLPPVELAPEAENSRSAYFRALEAADQNNLQPLMAIWQERLESTGETEDSP